MRTWGIRGLVAALAVMGVGVTAVPTEASATTPKVVLSGANASPATIGAAGGAVVLSALVSGATGCTVTVSPALVGFPTSVGCSTGPVSVTAELPMSFATKAVTYKFVLTASGGAGAKAKHVTVKAVESAGPPGVPATGVAEESGSCIVLTSGGVDCWGPNTSGQLGNGNHTTFAAAVPVTGITTAVSVTSDGAGTTRCALLTSGGVVCWGTGSLGQLGDGSNVGSLVPVPVTGVTGATALVAGSDDFCAAASGGIACWGDGALGQLGDGSTGDADVATPVTGITDAVSVVLSGTSSCAVLSSGGVDCWGGDPYGDLGNGTTGSSDVPVPVTGVTDATSVSAAGATICAVLATGAVDCWGNNQDQLLGGGTSAASSPVPLPVAGVSTAVSLTANGISSVCALLAGGGVDCWGDNTYGQLGDGTTAASGVPVPVTGLGDATAVVTDGAGNCALRASGAVTCWGPVPSGGSLVTADLPVAVSGVTDAVAVVDNGQYFCAVLASGGAVSWGSGYLGNGTLDSAAGPVVVDV